jgi:hypothetical protein
LDNKRSAFVSYARVDSPFAHRLAADLKSNGANVWIDHHEIRPGRQWDREVEQALTACSEVLVILSPAAIGNNNVMDEVGYALQHRKTVIPVLHTVCRVPLRLLRLQYIDFTSDYELGLQALMRELTSDHPVAPPSGETFEQEVAAPQESIRHEDAAVVLEAEKEPQAPPPRASRLRASKALVVAAASFLVLAASGRTVYWWMFDKPGVPSVVVKPAEPAPHENTTEPAPATTTVQVDLGDALPVPLTLAEGIPSGATPGYPLRFKVSQDVVVGDTVVIPAGAEATGAIVDAAKKKILGMGSKMTFRLKKVEAVDGQKVNLRATPTPDRDGSSKRPVDTGAGYLGYTDGANTLMVTVHRDSK